jgi:ABC-type phosphate/phosphonate transport system substrate-binding protein
MAKRRLLAQGIEMDKEMTVRFFNTHDAVVQAVLSGEVDAGTVRTDTLEQMSASGAIQLNDIKVLDLQKPE